MVTHHNNRRQSRRRRLSQLQAPQTVADFNPPRSRPRPTPPKGSLAYVILRTWVGQKVRRLTAPGYGNFTNSRGYFAEDYALFQRVASWRDRASADVVIDVDLNQPRPDPRETINHLIAARHSLAAGCARHAVFSAESAAYLEAAWTHMAYATLMELGRDARLDHCYWDVAAPWWLVAVIGQMDDTARIWPPTPTDLPIDAINPTSATAQPKE